MSEFWSGGSPEAGEKAWRVSKWALRMAWLLWGWVVRGSTWFGAGWRKRGRGFESGDAWSYVVSCGVSVEESDRCLIREDGKGVKCAALRQWCCVTSVVGEMWRRKSGEW